MIEPGLGGIPRRQTRQNPKVEVFSEDLVNRHPNQTCGGYVNIAEHPTCEGKLVNFQDVDCTPVIGAKHGVRLAIAVADRHLDSVDDEVAALVVIDGPDHDLAAERVQDRAAVEGATPIGLLLLMNDSASVLPAGSPIAPPNRRAVPDRDGIT